MITLEQIRLLEERVRRAVDRIAGLQEENRELRARATQYEERVSELEARIDRFTKDQNQIEDGIKKALDRLEGLDAEHAEPTATIPEAPETRPIPETASEPENDTDGGDTLAEPTDEANELDIF
ncbi:MAG: cell division protein ZapB [Spirochaetaceae bacterium]